jgi:biopolymer transport protein ExbD
MADMNTTPLIDVMLVLLIMFIITIPIQTHSIGIDLPGPGQVQPIRPDPVKNRVSIDAGGIIQWNGSPIDRLTLRRYLAATLRMPVEPELQFQPDAAARYVMVDAVLADIKRSGVTRLGFVGNERYRDF